MGFDAPLPFELPTAVSQVKDGDGSAPGGFADDVELANAAYGQAETFVTPLQMALVAATVANDGVLMKPHLVTVDDRQGSGTRTFDPSRMATVIDVERRASHQRARWCEAVEGVARAAVHVRGEGPGRDDRRQVRARPSWAARASRTRGSSASPRPRRRRSRSPCSSSRPDGAARSRHRSPAT